MKLGNGETLTTCARVPNSSGRLLDCESDDIFNSFKSSEKSSVFHPLCGHCTLMCPGSPHWKHFSISVILNLGFGFHNIHQGLLHLVLSLSHLPEQHNRGSFGCMAREK